MSHRSHRFTQIYFYTNNKNRYKPLEDDRDKENFAEQVKDILANIDEYQTLVDRNRKTALELGDWEMRASVIKETLASLNYSI